MKMSINTSYSGIRENFFDRCFCLFVALIPIVYVYNFPAVNVSIGTVLMFAFIPHVIIKSSVIKSKQRKSATGILVAILMYFTYLVVRSDGIEKQMLLYFVTIMMLILVVKGGLNNSLFRQNIETIAVINSLIILVQVVAHYLFHRNIQFIQYSLLQQDYKETYASVSTEFFTLYRPCGLFLEPSFNSQYCLFALISCLFSQNARPKYKRVLIICLGIILSTSGMGIMLMSGIITWFLFINKEKFGKKIRKIIIALGIICFLLPVLIRTPFFRNAIERVFSSFEGYNAIEGRTGNWQQALHSLNTHQYIFGLGGSSNYQWYLSGFPDTIYKYGVVGIILKINIFIQVIIRRRSNYIMCCSVVYLVLFCVAHLTGAFLDAFYICILLGDYYYEERILDSLAMTSRITQNELGVQQ